jgi:hypothetical protein
VEIYLHTRHFYLFLLSKVELPCWKTVGIDLLGKITVPIHFDARLINFIKTNETKNLSKPTVTAITLSPRKNNSTEFFIQSSKIYFFHEHYNKSLTTTNLLVLTGQRFDGFQQRLRNNGIVFGVDEDHRFVDVVDIIYARTPRIQLAERTEFVNFSGVGLVEFWQSCGRNDFVFVQFVAVLHVFRQQHGTMPQNDVLHVFGHDVQVESSEVLPVQKPLCAPARN